MTTAVAPGDTVAEVVTLPDGCVILTRHGQVLTTCFNQVAGRNVFLDPEGRWFAAERAIGLPAKVLFVPSPAGAGWQVTDRLVDILARHKNWSMTSHGPGRRTGGLLKHLRAELDEVEADPTDPIEWIDVAILALDGAIRSGITDDNPDGLDPATVVALMLSKWQTNLEREWPDWRQTGQDNPIMHIKGNTSKNR